MEVLKHTRSVDSNFWPWRAELLPRFCANRFPLFRAFANLGRGFIFMLTHQGWPLTPEAWQLPQALLKSPDPSVFGVETLYKRPCGRHRCPLWCRELCFYSGDHGTSAGAPGHEQPGNKLCANHPDRFRGCCWGGDGCPDGRA